MADSESSPAFALDRTGLWLLFSFTMVLVPATIVAAIWMLTHGFELAASSTFELIMAALSAVLVLIVIGVGMRELLATMTVKIDERGIAMGRVRLAWDEIEAFAAPAFGVLDITGQGRTLRLRTYLYSGRTALLEHIARKSGKTVPERGHGS